MGNAITKHTHTHTHTHTHRGTITNYDNDDDIGDDNDDYAEQHDPSITEWAYLI